MTKRVPLRTFAALSFLLVCSSAAHAQAPATVATDCKPGDWAYDAVQDLASKGLIKGYPPDGNFLGGRATTRYEMATIISRVLARMDDLASQPNASIQGMQTQIAEVQKLADDYKVELTVIGTHMDTAEADIKTLQGEVGDLQTGLSSALDAVSEQAARTNALKAQVAQAYSSNPKSKFNITGYIQARGVFAQSGSHSEFPQGASAVSGAYNGTYAQGGVAEGAEVRRARLRLNGSPTSNVQYAGQLDFSGASSFSNTSVEGTNGSATNVAQANQQVTVREAWASYTTGDGTPGINPTVTAGLFALPFGYALPASQSTNITPERPLVINENTGGIFAAQDYDKGIKAAWAPNAFAVTYAAVNGDGRNTENVSGRLDSVLHVAYHPVTEFFTVGASYYAGFIYRARPSSVPSPITYPKPKKDLLGLDAELNFPSGAFVDGEFVKGKYEQRSYFDEKLRSASNLIGGDSLQTDQYVKGNQIQGYYVWGGYTFGQTGNHAFTLAADYDVLQRSVSAQSSAYNSISNSGPAHGDSSFDDVNYGYGTLYNLDKALRLRLWYDTPVKVAHEAGTTTPPKISLLTAEAQVKF